MGVIHPDRFMNVDLGAVCVRHPIPHVWNGCLECREAAKSGPKFKPSTGGGWISLQQETNNGS
jgi:hypothetical protein